MIIHQIREIGKTHHSRHHQIIHSSDRWIHSHNRLPSIRWNLRTSQNSMIGRHRNYKHLRIWPRHTNDHKQLLSQDFLNNFQFQTTNSKLICKVDSNKGLEQDSQCKTSTMFQAKTSLLSQWEKTADWTTFSKQLMHEAAIQHLIDIIKTALQSNQHTPISM